MHFEKKACLFKYIIVSAFRIYALHGEEMLLKGVVRGRALNGHGHGYIVDHRKSWNCVF